MRILSPIVRAQAPLMASRQSDLGLCRAVRAQFVCHQHVRREALFLKQLPQQFHGCSLVASTLHKQIENLAFIINRAKARTAAPQSSRPSRRDAIATLAEGVDGEVLERTMARTSRPTVAPFVGHVEPALSEQIFDVAIAERETHIEPHGVPDDCGRKLVAGKRDRHPPSYPPNRDALPLL
jgi:hypothetical protein